MVRAEALDDSLGAVAQLPTQLLHPLCCIPGTAESRVVALVSWVFASLSQSGKRLRMGEQVGLSSKGLVHRSWGSARSAGERC